MLNIKAEDLRKVAKNMPKDLSDVITLLLNEICPGYGIINADIFHEFIANLLVESSEFMSLEENLNYSSKALRKLFSKERISDEECELLGRTAAHLANKAGIANKIYGGEWGRKNLGNTEPGDGYMFRGSGPIQITGRANTAVFTAFYNKAMGTALTPEQMAVLLRTDLRVGVHSACWFFSIAKDLEQLAVDDNMREIMKRINGGFNGSDARTLYYNLAKKIFI